MANSIRIEGNENDQDAYKFYKTRARSGPDGKIKTNQTKNVFVTLISYHGANQLLPNSLVIFLIYLFVY